MGGAKQCLLLRGLQWLIVDDVNTPSDRYIEVVVLCCASLLNWPSGLIVVWWNRVEWNGVTAAVGAEKQAMV